MEGDKRLAITGLVSCDALNIQLKVTVGQMAPLLRMHAWRGRKI